MDQTILKNYKEFLIFRNTLLYYGSKFKLPHEDIEELANDSIISALENFINERGSFESYCKVIFKHKILNFIKTSRDRFFLIIIDDDDFYLDHEMNSFEEKEKNQIAVNFIDRLKTILNIEEVKFLTAAYKICERSDIKLIAEASKNVGISNAKGWDIFRRIQRKALSIIEEDKNKKDDFDSVMVRENKIYYDFDSEEIDLFPKLMKTAVSEESDLSKIFIKLNDEQIKKLNELYQ